jgi:EAL domain-containing protein (putative c-di-GMP-specific phosphodiesterase class I)
MRNRRAVQLALIVFVTGCFLAVSQLVYHNIIHMWNKGQLEDLAARSIIRTELATDLAVSTIVQIQTRGLTTCSPEAIAAYRGYVMSVGSIKDIRLRSKGKTCAVFTADRLQADLDTPDIWQSGRNSAIRLGVLKQGNNNALSVLWNGEMLDLVAVISTGGLLYDMVPTDLRPYLKMQISLTNGTKIAAYKPDEAGYGNNKGAEIDPISFTASSKRYPITAKLTIDRAQIWVWNNTSSLLFDLLAGLTGLLVGFLINRTLFPPLGPIFEIDEAITNGEFVPYFQPIINLGSSEITGFEMLARWTKPDGEIIPPSRFIHLAENFGRMDALLFSLLRDAGDKVGFELRNDPDLKLTFNVTPEQFLDPTFLPHLLSVVKLAGLPTNNLVAEITERQPLADLELASQTIAQYKKHGIRIAIDDAGTGHNGLSSLQKLDVATLKLDKIFIDGIVDNERSRQMVELLANLAHQYKMNVVAEGIETPQQAAAAHSMGIQEGQGFYFSRPIPAPELLSLLAEQREPLIQNNKPNRKKHRNKNVEYSDRSRRVI